ncbi:hypothetical protein BFL36_01235 [Clavibacter michiganensis]|uniref:Uncharacterized protein n=1 Tax=Clavibacter michiganensis TaxID=28447 RepID=A0A251YWE8_9MICO|nr:hypothetical protein BFL36_01235 [Clavibacter michiganensis]
MNNDPTFTNNDPAARAGSASHSSPLPTNPSTICRCLPNVDLEKSRNHPGVTPPESSAIIWKSGVGAINAPNPSTTPRADAPA